MKTIIKIKSTEAGKLFVDPVAFWKFMKVEIPRLITSNFFKKHFTKLNP